MKIVDVNPFYYPYKGGIENRMYETTRRLVQRGHDVTIVTAQLSADDPVEEKSEGVRIIRLPSKKFGAYNPPYISSKNVLETVVSLDADIVNYNYRWAPSYNADMRKYDGKKVFTDHNTWGEGTGIMGLASKVNDRLFIRTLDTFDHIITVSDFLRSEMLHLGYSPEHITTIPNCLEEPAKAGAGKGDYILALGRLVKVKGYDYLLEAMKEVDCKLYLCGNGPEEKHLRSLIEKYGLEDRVVMPGYVGGEYKEELLDNCRFFVMPSVCEAFGIAAIEALSHGRAVVCSDADGLPATVGKGGYIVPKADSKSLVQAINDLLDHPDKLKELEKGAFEAAGTYQWDVYLPRLESVYDKVVSGELSRNGARATR